MFQECKINQIKQETTKDLILVELAKTIQSGWHSQHAKLNPDLHAYWRHHLNLSIIDEVIMNWYKNHCS